MQRGVNDYTICSLFFNIKYSYVVYYKFVVSYKVISFLYRLMIFISVAFYFCGNKYKLRTVGNIFVNMSVKFSVYVECVSVFVPKYAVAVEVFRIIHHIKFTNLDLLHIKTVTACEYVVILQKSRFKAFHNINFHTCMARVQR